MNAQAAAVDTVWQKWWQEVIRSLSPRGNWVPGWTKAPDLAKGPEAQSFDWNRSVRHKKRSPRGWGCLLKSKGILGQLEHGKSVSLAWEKATKQRYDRDKVYLASEDLLSLMTAAIQPHPFPSPWEGSPLPHHLSLIFVWACLKLWRELLET